MIEASKAAELGSQPTKRGRKAWLIALAVVVAVVTIVLLANAPKPEPVKVWFVRATNEAGVKKLVFEGTNGLRREIYIQADVFSGTTNIADMPWMSPSVDRTNDIRVPGGTNFVFALKEPPRDLPYYLDWWFYDDEAMTTRWARVQLRCYDFLVTHHMDSLAEPLADFPKHHYITSTSIKD